MSQLGFARCRCLWKLPRKDFLGLFSSCTTCSKLLHGCSSPSLPWPPHSCSPLHPRAEIAAHCCFSSPRDADLFWSHGRGTLGTGSEGLCYVLSTRAVAEESRCRAPTEVAEFHRGSFEGLNTFYGVTMGAVGVGWHQSWAGFLPLMKMHFKS